MANKLVLQLLADSNGLRRGLDDAQRALDRFQQSSSVAGRSLGGGVNQALEAFTGLAKGGAAAAGVLAGGLVAAATAATTLTLSAGRQVEAMDHLSQRTGIALQTIQRWSVVMAENDFQAESLTAGMRTLSKVVTDARNPASDAASTFEELGISITSLGSTEDVIRAVADKFAAMPDGVDKARLAVALFGKAGLELIPILNRGAAAFDASAKASERFGVVLSTQQVAALEAADDAADRLGVALQGLKTQLAATFAPSVAAATDGITAGIVRMTDAVRNLSSTAGEKKTLGLFDALAQYMPILGNLGRVGAAMTSPPLPPSVTNGPPMDSHVAAFAEHSADREQTLGLQMRTKHIEAYKQLLALQHAEQSQGRIQLEIDQRILRAVDEQLETMFDQEKTYKILTADEEHGLETMYAGIEAWKRRNDGLEMAVERSKVLDAAQQALFRSESGMLGASEAARRVRLRLIEDEGALQRRMIEETIFDETKKNAAIENLDIELSTRRRQAIQEFPTIWEQQLQTLVSSNTFSVGQIVTGWTGGLANAIVNFENFGQTMTQIGKQTAATLLQGILNFGVQAGAQALLQSSTVTAIKTAEAAAVIGINTAKNAAIVAGDTAGATATVTIWSGAGAAMVGLFGTITGAIQGLILGTILPALIEAGTAVVTFLSSIASALDASIFGIPFSVPVWAAVALVGAAIGTIAAFAFADGGIATGPTMGLIGEAGSSEAVIPLNKRGAAFMRETLGLGGGGGPTTIIVELDGQPILRHVKDNLPSILRLRGLPA